MSLLFVLAGIVALLGALGVVLARPPVHSVLALVAHLIAAAVLYLSLGAEFLAVTQVIVYAGAVMVLFLFVVSLLTARKDPVERPASRLRFQEGAGLALGSLLLLALGLGLGAYVHPPVGDAVPGFGSVRAFGEALFIAHLFPLQLAALILLVAVVGVVVLIARRSEPASQGREGEVP